MFDPPTEAQLRTLARLKYEGEPPRHKEEASLLIEWKKDGLTPARIAQRLAKARKDEARALIAEEREWFREERANVKDILRETQADKDVLTAGFIIKVGERCAGARMYDGAYLPLVVAFNHPELMPPYKDICRSETCECDLKHVWDGEKLPRGTKMIAGPGEFKTMRPGCMGRAVYALVAMVGLGYLLIEVVQT